MRKEAPKVMSEMRKKIQRVSQMLTAAVLALIMVLSMTGIKARAATSYQADLAIQGTVQFSGASNNETLRAEFRLIGIDGAPMPRIDSVAVDLTGENPEAAFSFDAVTYTSAGTYRYQVKQMLISSGYKMDTTIYDVTVYVTYEGENLTAVIYANKESDDSSKSEILFVNTKNADELPYTGGDEDPDDPDQPGTGGDEDPTPTTEPSDSAQKDPGSTVQPTVTTAKTPAAATAVRKASVPSVVRTISNAVKTGDTSSIALWLVIAGAAVLGMVVIVRKRKNQNRK